MDHICHPDGSLKLSTFFSVSLFFSFFILLTLKMTGTGTYELPWWLILAHFPALVLIRVLYLLILKLGNWASNLGSRRSPAIRRF